MFDVEKPSGRATRARDLQDQLLFLRKAVGFTPTRLAKAPVVQHLLGGSEEPFDAARERFVSAIGSLCESEAELLLAVYGLSGDSDRTGTLTARRKRHDGGMDRGTQTVAELEVAAISNLRSQLITGWYPQSPLAIRVPESHNGLVQESVSIRTLLVNGKWTETRERYRFVAAFDDVDYVTITTSTPGRPVAEGDFTVQTRRIGESFSHQFWHSGPMRRGRSYDLRFRLVPDPDDDDRARPTQASRAFDEPTRYASFEAVFRGAKPAFAWWYERLTSSERPGSPDDGQLLHLRTGTISARFRDPYQGLHQGIAWEW